MDKFLEILQLDYLGLIATVIGFIYLYLEFSAKKSMWIASIVMAVLYIYIFYSSEFYAMSLIYIYFFLISILGWFRWHEKQLAPTDRDASPTRIIPILRMPKDKISVVICLFLLSTVIISLMLWQFTATTWLILINDTIATSLNVVAIWMATRRWAEQWLLLIPANLITAIMLGIQSQYPASFMFSVYSFVSILGYFHWRKIAKNGES